MEIDELRKEMADEICWSYGGYSFETWLKHNAGEYGCVAWASDADPEVLRKLYEELPKTPEVGDPCTEILYSDTYGMTIVSVEFTKSGKPKRVGVRKNKYKVIDFFAGDEECTDELEGGISYYTLRKGGGWYAEGEPKANGSCYLSIGYRRTYLDPSF